MGKTMRWVIPGNRLLLTDRAAIIKRPARRRLPEFQTTGRSLAPLQAGGLTINPRCLRGRERSASFSLCSLGLGSELLNKLAGYQELDGLT
jgi:hypothetical protein